jgi:hypothetical protein
MKTTILLFLIFTAFFFSCSQDVATVQVIRNPLIKFDFNSTSSWKSDSYSFADVSKVVVYPNDTTKPGRLYNRLTLQALGRDNTGNHLQLIINFDAVDVSHLIGIYSPVYSTERGLADVRLFNLTNSNDLSAFNLCDFNISNATFQIQKQDITEQLIKGVFQMTLCDARDSTKKINIINGTLTDIHY